MASPSGSAALMPVRHMPACRILASSANATETSRMRHPASAEAGTGAYPRKRIPGRTNGSSVREGEYAQHILQAMLALRDGDLSQRLPAGWSGVFGKIAEAFNDVAALNDRRVRENQRVCQAVGKEGKLKQRMNVPG